MTKKLSINAIYRRIFKIWRVQRHAQFLRTLNPGPRTTILDVGGYPGSWTCYDPVGARVDCLNLHAPPWKSERAPRHAIQMLEGDGCDLPFPDQTYDIAFSNSVIEHVGSYENQCRFAEDIRRVGKQVWLQTPARECPIEPHYLAPFVHYLPASVQKRIVRWVTPWGWLKKPTPDQVSAMVDTTRLLTYREMRTLFPDCQIRVERMLGVIPKSYIAVRV